MESQEKFASPKFRDVFWGVLFLIHLLGVFAFIIVRSLQHWKGDWSDDIEPTEVGIDEVPFFITLALSAVVGLVFSAFTYRFTRGMIVVAMGFTVLSFLGSALLSFTIGNFTSGIILLFFAGLIGLMFYLWRRRIPFAVVLLQTVTQLMRMYPATVGFSISSLFVQFIWTAIWGVAVLLLLTYNSPLYTLGAVFLILSYYWTSQVIQNLVHVTSAGTFATWYFLGESVSNPTLHSFKRASTYSFGSICFGSLLVALINTLRAIVRSMRNTEISLIVMCMDCILSCMDWLVRYFNKYAFVTVAIYGKSYWQSAKDTFDMFERTGLLALVNDSIVGTVLSLGCFIGGVITAIAGGVFGFIFVPDNWIIATVAAFFIGFTMVAMTTEVIDSGVATLFVCFAEDPYALQRNRPDVYEQFMIASRGHRAPRVVV